MVGAGWEDRGVGYGRIDQYEGVGCLHQQFGQLSRLERPYLYHYYEMPKLMGWGRLHGFLKARARAAQERGRLPLVVAAHRTDDRFCVGVRPLRTPFRHGRRCYVGSASRAR